MLILLFHLLLDLLMIDVLVQAECQFPQYLQSVKDSKGKLKPWNTRVWWLDIRDEPNWTEKQEIFVEKSKLTRHKENKMRSCDRASRAYHKTRSFGKCSKRHLVYNRTCVEKEGPDKYRVIQYDQNRRAKFICMKFIKRTNSVVQIMEGKPRDANEPGLCDEKHFHTDDWPWIAPWRDEPYLCPITGGFKYRTVSRLTNEDTCESEWRLSRLEIECINGDGMNFMAPNGSKCNPFTKTSTVKRLTCWAGWEMGNYVYVIASELSQKPRYCLRFPRNPRGEFTVLVYYSAICPSDPKGIPPHRIQYYEMKMRRIEPGECQDESKRCEMEARNGKCEDRQSIGIHCERTCAICVDRDLLFDKCVFDIKLQGSWRLFDYNRNESVNINRTHIYFSEFGTFMCKERGYHDEQYKVLSYFNNGCVPRYSCMEFNRTTNNLLRYRISESHRENKDFKSLCVFNDDNYPILDLYRSFNYKNLILNRNLWSDYCGKWSSIPFNGTWDGQPCEGTMSNWDDDNCTWKVSVMFRSQKCQPLRVPQEFQCLAYIRDSIGVLDDILITRTVQREDEFNCWVISSDIREDTMWPYRTITRMSNTQCSDFTDVAVHLNRQTRASLILEDDASTKVCKRLLLPPSNSGSIKIDLATTTIQNVHKNTYRVDEPRIVIRQSTERNDNREPMPSVDKDGSGSSSVRFLVCDILLLCRVILTVLCCCCC